MSIHRFVSDADTTHTVDVSIDGPYVEVYVTFRTDATWENADSTTADPSAIEQAVDAMDLAGEILGECIAADMPRKRAVQAATPLCCALQGISPVQDRRAS